MSFNYKLLLSQPRRETQIITLAIIIGFVLGYSISNLTSFEFFKIKYKHARSDPHSHDEMGHGGFEGPDIKTHNETDEFHKFENRSIAKDLFNKVRVLCWVMTGPQNHKTKAVHVKRTWGKRCNFLVFMSSQEDKDLNAVALPVQEGRDNLWAKTKEAFKFVHKNYLDKADFFLKADDDTYVVLENLRYMLKDYKSNDSLYFGCRFKPYVKQGYMSGGAGYVLSKEALKRFVEKGIPNKTICKEGHSGAEDVEVGKCLENLNVTAVDTRDAMGRGRFFPFVPEHHIITGHRDPSFWYWQYIYFEEKEGMDCCSDYAVSFHYINPNMMYVLEYLIYHLKPYGVTFDFSLTV